MKKRLSIWIGLAVVVLATGCGTKDRATVEATQGKQEISDGTLEPFCREWTNSPSAYKRNLSTNMFLLYANGAWRVREIDDDGKLESFWISDPACKDSSSAMRMFEGNIDFCINKALYDAFAGTPTDAEPAKPARELPDGYEIGMDGEGKYRWKDEDGFVSLFQHATKAGAVEAACIMSDYAQGQTARSQWAPVSDTTSP